MVKLLALLFPLLVLSCSSDDAPIVPETGLVGAWQWTGTYGGLSGQLATTPESTGTDILLELGDDERYAVFSDHQEVQSGTYALTLEESIYNQQEERYITFTPEGTGEASGSDTAVYGVFDGIIAVQENGELTIDDNHYDGIGSVFVRR